MRNNSWSLRSSAVFMAFAVCAAFFMACSDPTGLPTFTVSFNLNGGIVVDGGATPAPQSVDAGASLTLPGNTGFSRSGFVFANSWNTSADGSGTFHAAGATFTPSGNITLHAMWNPVRNFTVIFHANNGEGNPPNPETVQEGSSITLPGAGGLERPGYTFGGWNTMADGGGTNHNVGGTFQPTDDTTLFARWHSNVIYTVSFNANSGTGTVPAQTTPRGEPIILPGGDDLSRGGYTFGGWNSNSAGTGTEHLPGAAFTPSGDTTLFARWHSIVIYTVTFDSNSGTGTVPAQTTPRGEPTILPGGDNLSRGGFTFGGWNSNSAGTGTEHLPGTAFTPTGNTTLFARWIPVVTFTVSFNVNQGSGTVSAQTTTQGVPIILPSGAGLSRGGHIFGGWNRNAAGTGENFNAGTPFLPTADVILYARWVPSFTITFNSNFGIGTVPSQTVGQGDSIPLPGGGGLSRLGYAFGGWNTTSDGHGTNHSAGAIFTPTGNVTLYARWLPSFTVTFNSNLGTGTVPSQTVGQGDSIMLPGGGGLSRLGYAFGGWNTTSDGHGANHSAGSMFTPTGNITLYARWLTAFTVTFNSNQGTGTVPAQAVIQGGSMTLPSGDVLSRAGYVFDGWNENAAGAGINRNAGDSFTPSGNITLYARWVPGATFTVTFNVNGGTGTAPAPRTVPQGSGTPLPGGDGLSRSFYVFVGWSTNAASTGANYNAGDIFTPTANVTLFARWELDGTTVPGYTLAQRLAWLQTNATTGGDYLLEMTMDENIAPHALSFAGRTNITVTFRGAEARRTIGLLASGSLFTVGPGVTLVLDSNITLNGRPDNSAPLVQVNNGGTLVMNAGGRIFGNINTNAAVANHGGGVRVNGGGTFNMNGGEILGNASSATAGGGGGVFVALDGANVGTFNMRGGTISGNSAGGTGGGVHNAGTFRMSEGVIPGNNADIGLANVAGNGAALFNGNMAQHGTFVGNIFTQLGSMPTMNPSVYVSSGLLQLTGTVGITGTAQVGQTLTAVTGALGGSGDISFQWRRGTVNIGTNSDTYTLQVADLGSTITVMVSRTRNAGSVTSAPTAVIEDTYGNIMVPGNTLAERLAWLRANAYNGNRYLIAVSDNEALTPAQAALPTGRTDLVITLYGIGTMRSIDLSTNGNLFTVGSGLTLVLGDNITLNGRPANNSHLVQVNSGGTLVMNGGTKIAANINTSTLAGAQGGGVRVNSSGTFYMHGGEISGNASTGDGGGIFIASAGTFNMRGGTISGNDAGGNGGGLHNAGTLRISDGIIYGTDAEPELENTASNGAALSGTVLLGTFGNAGFEQLSTLSTTDITVHVINGILQGREGSHTVNFNANSGSGVTPASQMVNAGFHITIPSGDGLSRNGYVFDGWNTMSDGSGTHLSVGVTFTPTGNITLYARWLAIFTITFNANGGSGALPAQTVNEGSSITLPGGEGLSKTSHVFIGWNTVADGTGTDYAVGSVFAPTGNITLYARWIAVFTVTFSVNGGVGTTPSTQEVNEGISITLPSGEGFSKAGHVFTGWNTVADGTGTDYTVGSVFAPMGSVTLYARWVAVFIVTFNANGGIGTVPAPRTVTVGSSITLPDGEELSKSMFIFTGWTKADDAGTAFNVGSLFTPTNNITLYARWDFTGIVPGATLVAQLDWLRTYAQSGGDYIVELTGDESIAPQVLSFGARNNITINIRGNEIMRTIDLSANGSLFTVDSGVTLVLDSNVTLQGRNANDSPLVQVNSGGALTITTGVRITGNTNASPSGGGVRIDGDGILTMYGGEISDNHNTSTVNIVDNGGGGVNVAFGGAFDMHGGMIFGNTARRGGGVNIVTNGAFTMHMGEIYGNIADQGGGVNISGGTFNMYGGVIHSNTATNNEGGGVSVFHNNAFFTMHGGEIIGNTANRGGGVYVIHNAIFVMHGGDISANTADWYGGGIAVAANGIFRISNGVIHGSNATMELRNTARDNAALSISSGTAQYGTFSNGTFTSLSTLSPSDNTIHVVDGVLQ